MWLSVRVRGQVILFSTLAAHACIVRRASGDYAGRLSPEEVARLLATAVGGRGVDDDGGRALERAAGELEAGQRPEQQQMIRGLAGIDPLRGSIAIGGDIRQLVAADPECRFLLDPARLDAEDVFAVVGGPPCVAFSKSGFWLDWKRDGVDPAATVERQLENACHPRLRKPRAWRPCMRRLRAVYSARSMGSPINLIK